MKPPASFPDSRGADDSTLLRAFATRRDEAAFRVLTERYAGMMYGIAARRLGDPNAAQEVASEVFSLLARKASGLTQTGCLAAWLHRSAVLVTANAARREIRRRNAMNAYAHSSDPAAPHATEDPAWRAGAEHLDDAMARLPERDRALLMARYFAGLTHGEIARGRGIGEESVKKAGQRALNKLRALLLRRGVTLSVAVLASGLPRHVQAAAPEGFAAHVSAAALGAAPTLGLLPALRHSITYMFYGKTLTTTAGALLLCAALGGGSFLAAQQLAARFSHAPANVLAGAAQAPDVPVRRPEKPSDAKPGVREIVEAAVRLLRGSRKEGSPGMDRAVLLLAGLTLEETRAAALAAENYRGEGKLAEALATALGAAWAEKDPAGALAWLEVFPEPAKWPNRGGADKIVLAWFERDGPAAWDWWLRRSQAVPPPAGSWAPFIGEGAGVWARTDPAAATAAVGKLDASFAFMSAFAEQLRQRKPDTDAAIVDAALEWKNPSLRAELAYLLVLNSTNSTDDVGGQLARVFSFLNRLCAGDAGALETAVAPLVKGWAGHAPVEAAAWILDEASASPANTRALLEPALRALAEGASEDASRWVQERLRGEAASVTRIYDALLSQDSQALVERSPWPTFDWSRRIADWDPEFQEGFVRFWAEQRLHPEWGDPVPPEEIFTRWRKEITRAETKGNQTGAELARRALRYAETLSAAPAVSTIKAP